MPMWLNDDEFETLAAACERMIPPGAGNPGATAAGVPEYIDGLLGAFSVDPPRIWARGPTSGRFGGADAFSRFHPLSALDELAWRTRIEGSAGKPEREFNGPVVGLQQIYRHGLAALGADFCQLGPAEQAERLRNDTAFADVLYGHVCEGMYGPPEYGGNRQLVGWRAIDFDGDVQPRGFTDAEVSAPEVPAS
jgi:hypothetical protein